VKHVQPFPVLGQVQDVKPPAEDRGKVGATEEAVVVARVYQPVPGSTLSGVMLELRGETGQEVMPSRPSRGT
jgi:hypothetical protein